MTTTQKTDDINAKPWADRVAQKTYNYSSDDLETIERLVDKAYAQKKDPDVVWPAIRSWLLISVGVFAVGIPVIVLRWMWNWY